MLLIHRRYGGSPAEARALEQHLAVVADDWFVPLPVARVDQLFELVAEEGDAKGAPRPVGATRGRGQSRGGWAWASADRVQRRPVGLGASPGPAGLIPRMPPTPMIETYFWSGAGTHCPARIACSGNSSSNCCVVSSRGHAMSRKLLRTLRAESVESHGGMASPHRGGYAWLSRLPLDFLRWAGYACGTLSGRPRMSSMKGSLPFRGDGDVLIIVPPFASLWYPSLAAHVLQACVRQEGFRADVLYANIMLASFIGEQYYEKIAAESVSLASERFFARYAFGLPPLGHAAERLFDPLRTYGVKRGELYRGLVPDGEAATLGAVKPIKYKDMIRLEAAIPQWLDRFCTAIA